MGLAHQGFVSVEGDLQAGELAIVRVRRDFENTDGDTMEHLDPALPDTLTVTSSGDSRTNRVRWLTTYQADSNGQTHAERPKLVAVGDDQYVVLWERWDLGGSDYEFTGPMAMLIDANGSLLAGPTNVGDSHLPRGDDAFPLEGGAAWLTGDNTASHLQLPLVDANLGYRVVTIE